MTNIIVHGFVSNKLVTQGYHSGAVIFAPSGMRGLRPPTVAKRKLPLPVELLSLIRDYLKAKLGE